MRAQTGCLAASAATCSPWLGRRVISQFLISAADICRRGVKSVPHNKSDAYYKLLLKYRGPELLRKIEELVRDPDMLGLDDDLNEPMLALVDQPSATGAVCAYAEVSLTNGWVRCRASRITIDLCLSVYFDHFSHQSGVQRGWADCPAHGCIRYKFVHEFSSREHFVADMLAWLQAGIDGSHATKDAHLQYSPPSDVVQLVQEDMRVCDV